MSIVDNAGEKVDKIFKLNTFMIAHKKKMIMKDYSVYKTHGKVNF